MLKHAPPIDNEALVLDFLEWLGDQPKTYDEVMTAWRTSCPRLTIWEDAVDASLVEVRARNVRLTAAGQAFLTARRT